MYTEDNPVVSFLDLLFANTRDNMDLFSILCGAHSKNTQKYGMIVVFDDYNWDKHAVKKRC